MLALLITVSLCGLATCDVKEKERLSQSRVNSDYTGLQAPLQGSATSANQRRIISLHHNPEDENNLERLCNDPFHSFLCKPVGPRRNKFDGRLRPGAVLPPGVVPASSNIREESQPLQSGSALLPTSIEDDRKYLPPASDPQPFIQSEPNYLPPEIPGVPNFAPLPSANNQAYLAVPFPRPNLLLQYSQPLRNEYLPVKNQSNNHQGKQQFPTSSNEQPVKAIFPPKNAYLPVADPSESAESTNLSPNIQGKALLAEETAKDYSNDKESHSLERLCNDPFHSFLCKPTKPRKRIDGRIRPGAQIPPNVLIGSSSIRRESRVLPTEEGSALLPSSLPSNNYLPSADNKPKRNESFTTSPILYNYSIRYEPPQRNSYVYPSPSNPVRNITYRNGYNYPNPTNSFSLHTQNPTNLPVSHQPNHDISSKNQNSNYYTSPRPDIIDTNLQLTENQSTPKPTAFQSPTTSIATVFSATFVPSSNRPVLSNNNEPNPTKVQQNVASLGTQNVALPSSNTGYNYEKPPNPFAYSTNQRPSFLPSTTYQTASKPTQNDYQYAKPSNVQQNFVRPSEPNGYHYEKPSNPFDYSTTPRPTFPQSTTAIKKPDYQDPNPSNIQQNYVRPNGYNYERPSVSFSPSNMQQPTTLQTTNQPTKNPATFGSTAFPTVNYKPIQNEGLSNNQPNPTNIQQHVVNPSGINGYNYPKPAIPFNYQTTSSPIFTTLRPVSAFPSNKPVQNEYIYPRPQSSGTTQRPLSFQTTTLPTTIQTVNFHDNQNEGYPSNVQQNFARPSGISGYTYKKPSVPFSYSTISRPTFLPSTTFQTTTNKPFAYQYTKPSNVHQTVLNPNGYNYEKPVQQFNPSTTSTPTTLQPSSFQTSTYLPPTVNGVYPKPSNVQQTFVRPNVQNGYSYPQPAIPFTYSTTLQPTFIPSTTYQTTKPNQDYQPSNFQQSFVKPNGYNYEKPSISFTYSTTPTPTISPTTNYQSTTITDHQYPKPSNVQQTFLKPNGYNYNKPSDQFNPSTTQRPIAFQTTKRPTTFQSTTFKPLQTDGYPKPSNVQQSIASPTGQNGYNYQKPFNPFTYPTTLKPTVSTTFQSTTHKPFQDYQYPKPTNIQQNFVKPNGYNYDKPSVQYNPVTTQRPTTFQTTARPPTFQTSTLKPLQSDGYPKPSNFQPDIVKPSIQNGYNYQRPSVQFTYPTTPKPTFLQSSTYKPIKDSQYPKPTNIQQNFVKPHGYIYDKPSVQYNPITTQRPMIFQTTARPPTFQTSTLKPLQSDGYPKPSNFQPDIVKPSVQNGYNYQKPSVQFTYPTTPKPTLLQSSTYKPIKDSQYPKPTNIQQNFVKPHGYIYDKPSVQYNPTTTQRPTTFQTTVRPTFFQTSTYEPASDDGYPKPSNFQPNIVKPSDQNGYNYQKPSVPFTYATTPRPTFVPSTTFQTTTIKPIQNFNYPEPSNIQPNFAKPNGYNYNKPSDQFNPTTTQISTFQTTIKPTTFQTSTYKPTQNEGYPRPSNIQQSIVKPNSQNGYEYQKPSTQRPLFLTSTYRVPQKYPSNEQQNVNKPQPSGYHYNKPSNVFTYPTTIKPTTHEPFPTTAVPFNPFPNPSNVQENVAPFLTESGYDYRKPSKPFSLPSENKNLRFTQANEPSDNTVLNSSNGLLRFGDRLRPRINLRNYSTV